MAVRSSKLEAWVGTTILLVLAVVAVGVFWEQYRFDPSLFRVAVEEGKITQVGLSNGDVFQRPLVSPPQGMKPISQIEGFGPDSLSDKIDGKAELYLSSGFVNLRSQRFGREKDTGLWLEIFVYDMQNARNAFSVYSSQMRDEAQKLDFTAFAYRTPNAVFLIRGKEYIEIVASSQGLQEEMLSLGRTFASSGPSEHDELGEIALFPSEGLEAGTISLHASNVFGFDRLNNTFTARYNRSGQGVTAFLSIRANAGEASELASAYRRFLTENGAVELEGTESISGGLIVQVFDTYECIFSHERYFAGVHEAESRESAVETAVMLYGRLKGSKR